jgi:flagella basal body P-ring formation protein FlgA
MPLQLAPLEALTRQHLATLLATALASPEVDRRIELEITRPQLPLANRSARPVTLRLVDLALDEPADRFAATIEVAVEDGPVNRLTVGGKAVALARVVVPLRRVTAGEPLVAGALAAEWLPARGLPEDVLREPDVEGLETVRTLAPGRPVRLADLRPRPAVRKGDLVAVEYRRHGLAIATHGRALQDGVTGDVIRLVNPQSDRQIKAVIVGDRRVVVGGQP